MSLNVKAALGICFLFIVGLCWLVAKVDLPEAIAGGGAGPIAAVEPPAAKPVQPQTGPPQFARRSPLHSARADESSGDRIPVAPLPPPKATTRTVSLPPLARAERPVASETEPAATAAPELGPVRLAANDVPAGHTTPTTLTAIAAEPLTMEMASHTAPPPPADESAAPAVAAPTRYVVKRGDSLTRIATQVFGSADQKQIQKLLDANPKLKARPDKVLVGEELVIPSPAGEPAAPGRPGRSGDAPADPRTLAAAPVKPPRSEKAAPAPRAAERAAEVRGGKGSPAIALVSDKASPDVAGRKPAKSASPPQDKAGPKSKTADKSGKKPAGGAKWYTVQQSDSLKGIAQRVLGDAGRWRELAELNALRDPNKLVPGKRLKLPTDAASQG